ncbi:MAG TPA: type II secretion system F family protein [Gemmataceae bacterium]|nr:type II secretion system F family protein [Gemmataceae bacterium]
MLLSGRLPLSSLIDLCRTLRHYLGAGLTLRDVFRQQAQKGSLAIRPVAARIAERLEHGDDLESALENERHAFPPLFLALAGVGEQTGNLPEVFAELEKYYRLQQKLWRQFIAQIRWPALQFGMAVAVITLLIWILGIIADTRGGQPMDPLGLGLTGTSGAITFLAGALGFVAGVFGLYLFVTRVLRQQGPVDEFLLWLPAIGPCLRALALARFCLALRLTTESGMSITKALRLSLRATGNGAFIARIPIVERTLKAGDELAVALARCRIFGNEFINIVAVGEESGRIAEVMEHQAEYYGEEAAHRLKLLAQVAAWGVWLFVAALIIFAIFRIYSLYLGAIDAAAGGVF